MDTVNVTLTKPVEHDGKTYSGLTFREPDVGDLLLAETASTDMGRMVNILASISDVPVPAFKKIKGSDFKTILKETKDLLGNGETNTTGA
ncbi:MAG TPA: phage tail assembly protein [Ensifer sp.]|nr:phage tail assembly protein [Ensifer sp.]